VLKGEHLESSRLDLENLIVCSCGNNTWFIGESGMRCTSCNMLKDNPFIDRKSNNSQVIEAMGIPPGHPNAIELARLRLQQLKKKDEIIEKIRKLIDSN